MSYRLYLPGVACLLPLTLLSVPALAADEALQPFADAGQIPTVLSATRLQQSLFETPAAVTVIDRQMIEQSGMREIPELLRLVPGMVVGYDTGSDAFVSFHGTSADLARRMQVLVDGRSIYQPLLASVDWIGLPLELGDIERIEVIRGPNSSTWGANSFFAVVNIITRHPADVERARISYRAGEDGVEDYLARLARHSGALDWRLTVAGRNDDGFEENRRRGNANFTDSKTVDSVYGRGVWAVSEGSSLELSFGMAGMDAEQQYRPTFFIEPPVGKRDNDFLSISWDQEMGDAHRLRLQASQSRFRREEIWNVLLPRVAFSPILGSLYDQNRACANGLVNGDISACTPADMPLIMAFQGALAGDPLLLADTGFQAVLDSRERRTGVEVQDTWVISQDLRTVYGLTYDKAEVDSQTFLAGSGENTVWRAFFHGEWRFAPEWLLNIGGNQEDDEGAGTYFSPRVALNWQFTPAQVLRAVYSRAVRTPDILENQANFGYYSRAVQPADALYSGTFYQTGKANGTAPTERIDAHEVGYYARFDAIHLSVDLRGFRDRMQLSEHNLEVDGSEGFLIRPLEEMYMTGAELGTDWRPVPGQRFQLNYAYIDMDGVTSRNDNTGFVPQHSGSVAWWMDYGKGLQFGMTYAFYNDLRADRRFFFDRIEHRLSRTFRIAGGHRLTLAAVMQTRLTDDPELREENGGDRHRGWFSLDWHY